jgi:hypothetical protein
MTFRNRYLFILVSAICIVGLIFQWIQHERPTDIPQGSRQLSGAKQVIDLRHVQRDCLCPDWIRAAHYDERSTISPDSFLYLEPASSGVQIPDSFLAKTESGWVLRLEGAFYQGNTLPNNYVQKTEQKPEKARVFYYESSAVVKPE